MLDPEQYGTRHIQIALSDRSVLTDVRRTQMPPVRYLPRPLGRFWFVMSSPHAIGRKPWSQYPWLIWESARLLYLMGTAAMAGGRAHSSNASLLPDVQDKVASQRAEGPQKSFMEKLMGPQNSAEALSVSL